MSFEIHRNNERGHITHGWLESAHSFSFARYVNEERMNFGALLVLNEDVIHAGQGFGEHFHDNMEIITIPLSGALRHGDSMGNSSVIKEGDVQIMSAGTGIMHSERNASDTEPVHLLQIWIVPKVRGLPTRYDELHLGERARNEFHTVVAPQSQEGSVQIHQDAWFRLGQFDAQHSFAVTQHQPQHGTFLFVISGKVQIGDATLGAGDAYAMRDEAGVRGVALEPSHLLAIEVPMNP